MIARARRARRAAAGAAALAVLVAACVSQPASRSREDAIRSTATAVPFTGCGKVACTGTLDGAKYEIDMPRTWNGTLLLFSHGYRAAQPVPPDLAPVQTDAQDAPTGAVATALLNKGYALAGSAYATNGWAVADGVTAGEQLHDFFVQKVGRPDRTYVWGESLGGLISEMLAEKHPDWIAGAAPLCGVLGGTNLNFDLAMDLAYGVKTLLVPGLKIDDYGSYDEARASFEQARKAVIAATDSTAGVGKLLLLAALVDAPTRTANYDGSTLQSRGGALVEGILTGLAFGTTIRQELEGRVGGNPSGNEDTDYAVRVSASERALIESVAPGSTAANLALLANSSRVGPDDAARAKFAGLGTPTGAIRVPTLTLHTEADPLVLVQNESVFAGTVAASTAKTADLVQLYTKAPAHYAKPAPYGAGHCNFTADELTGSVTALDGWARGGVYPTGPAVTAAFGRDPGLDLSYRPGPWPAATS
jgi:pimeloyl-ACP methyl ester carboxylesterase